MFGSSTISQYTPLSHCVSIFLMLQWHRVSIRTERGCRSQTTLTMTGTDVNGGGLWMNCHVYSLKRWRLAYPHCPNSNCVQYCKWEQWACELILKHPAPQTHKTINESSKICLNTICLFLFTSVKIFFGIYLHMCWLSGLSTRQVSCGMTVTFSVAVLTTEHPVSLSWPVRF